MAKKEDVLTEFTIIPETRPIWKKRRYHNVVLAFWAFIMVHSLRTNLSVAIVSMSEEVRVQKKRKVDVSFHFSNNFIFFSSVGIQNYKVLFCRVSIMDTYLLNYSGVLWREKLVVI